MFRINNLSAALTALFCVSSGVLAGSPAASSNSHHTPRYRLVEFGSFGGTFGLFSNPAAKILNRRGAAVGMNNTAAPDPYEPNCFFACQIDHAFIWKNGVTTDLGTLPGGASSFPDAINDRGVVVGASQNGQVDALTGFPQQRAVEWLDGSVIDLGALGGTQSAAFGVNNRGQIVGAALNAVPDPFAGVVQAACLWMPSTGPDCGSFDFAFSAQFAPATTQTHATLWSDGVAHDLGTLGGPDSNTALINDHGQIAGWSYTSYTANASGVPTQEPFLWERGRMISLGSLGGTVGAPSFMNERGQVVGASNLAGDTIVHPFLWSRATGMRDLGTLPGGNYAHPDWINEVGDVVGFSNTGKDSAGHRQRHAFYWHDDHMTDLGTLGTDPASEAFSINDRGQIVGLTFVPGGDDLRAFLSDNGGPLIELNTLIQPASDIQVITAVAINDRGEIVGTGKLPNGEIHPIMLIPLDGDKGDDADSGDAED